MLFTVPFYHFLFLRYLVLAERHFSSGILVLFSDSNNLFSRRKDPAATLYTHLVTPPKVVFYNFACSLSEYVKNRDSGYFRNTSSLDDVFHGFSHKCSPTFRCFSLNMVLNNWPCQKLGNLGNFFRTFSLPTFRFWSNTQNRKLGRWKLGKKFRDLQAFRVFDLPLFRFFNQVSQI